MQFTALTTLALAAVAVAIPTGSAPSNQCNTGPIQCCQSVQRADAPTASDLLGLLGIVVKDLTTQIGMACSPLGVGAISGNSCSQQSVCCSNNSFNGVVAIGCTPININA